MNRLFKYCGPSGTQILSTNAIKVTPPIELNDPFEVSPVVRTIDLDKKVLERAEKSITQDYFEQHRLHFLHFKDFKDFEKEARANLGQIIDYQKKETLS